MEEALDLSSDRFLDDDDDDGTCTCGGTRYMGWVVNATPRPLYLQERDPVTNI